MSLYLFYSILHFVRVQCVHCIFCVAKSSSSPTLSFRFYTYYFYKFVVFFFSTRTSLRKTLCLKTKAINFNKYIPSA